MSSYNLPFSTDNCAYRVNNDKGNNFRFAQLTKSTTLSRRFTLRKIKTFTNRSRTTSSTLSYWEYIGTSCLDRSPTPE